MAGSCRSGLGTPGGSGSQLGSMGHGWLGWVGRGWELEAGLGRVGRGWVAAGLQLGCVGARLEREGRG